MVQLIQKFDDYVLLYITNNMHSNIMDRAMIIITSLGNMGAIWIVISVLLIINKKYRGIGFMILGALMLSSILGDIILKNLAKRMRPCIYMTQAQLLISKPLSYSFPSGHTSAAFASAGILKKYFKKYAIEIITLASLIAFSRMYLYVHYPTDVLAGIILGIIYSKITIYLFHRVKHKLRRYFKEGITV